MNTISDLVALLVEHSSAITAATRGRAFEANVHKFTEALATIPDYPYAEMTPALFEQANRLAEQVIESIEARLYDGDDRESLKGEMARSIYVIRKAQEDVFRWKKHFGRI
jgi:hypothetical protein